MAKYYKLFPEIYHPYGIIKYHFQAIYLLYNLVGILVNNIRYYVFCTVKTNLEFSIYSYQSQFSSQHWKKKNLLSTKRQNEGLDVWNNPYLFGNGYLLSK